MHYERQIINRKGKQIAVPAIKICNVLLVITGKLFKIARIHDEEWLESRNLPDPLEIIEALKNMRDRPDIFTFAQKIPEVTPRYPFPFEWENAAVATIESYRLWFDKAVHKSVRKHIRKAQREGIVTEIVPFDDKLVEGICSIYNESKFRQGKKFWHYGKSFDAVKRENGTYLDRSIFIGAYFGNELVGFIKFVIDGEVAQVMQILSKVAYLSKCPNNALISKAIEICESRHIRYLTYGVHTYGKKDKSSLIKFKEENGFKKIEFPRYYVPLTRKGYLGVKFGFYKDWKSLIPASVARNLLYLRSKYYTWLTNNFKEPKKSG